MKKFISVALSLILALSLTIPVLATDDGQSVHAETHFNEYDYILSIQQASPEKLSDMGLTSEDAAEIVASFTAALQERATLPTETLLGYGYTHDEIYALRTYNSRNLRSTLSPDVMRAISGTCTGSISSTWMTNTEATFMYQWEWDHAPLVRLKDSVAMRWLAFDKYADDIDVTITSHSSNINYYSNGTKCFSRRGSWEPNLEFNSLNLQFEEAETYQSSTTTDKAYALDGHVKVSVKLESGVESRIKYIKVAALYGHTTIGDDFPSISLSVPASISIGFSGNLSIDSIASAQAKIEIGSSSSRPVVTDLLDN